MEQLHIKLSKKDKEILRNLANKKRMTMSGLIKDQIFNKQVQNKNLYDKIEFLQKKVHWLEKENELLTIQKERAESLLIN
jgi:hypothetical protein